MHKGVNAKPHILISVSLGRHRKMSMEKRRRLRVDMKTPRSVERGVVGNGDQSSLGLRRRDQTKLKPSPSSSLNSAAWMGALKLGSSSLIEI
jgi:hypothetical protein